MSWRDRLPEPKADPEKMIKGIMVRPGDATCRWLHQQAKKYHTSVNKIVLAIIEAEAAKELP